MSVGDPATLNEQQLDAALRALGSAQRREILRFLRAKAAEDGKTCCGEEEVCACKLSEHLGLAASTISHHMSALRDAGLVSARKDGSWVYYTVCRDVLEAVCDTVRGL